MNLSQQFRYYIQSQVNNNKAILGTVVKQDLTDPTSEDYGSWIIQPIDDEPPIFGVVSGQDNAPEIGSLVVVQFLDNQNAFITHIFEYKKRSVQAEQLNIGITEDIEIKGKTLTMDIEELMKVNAKLLEIVIQQTIKMTSTQATAIEGNGVKIKSNGVDLGSILQDILTTLGVLNTAILPAGSVPAAANIAALTPKITAFNA